MSEAISQSNVEERKYALLDMKTRLWNGEISPSAAKPAVDVNTLFELIFGVTVRLWFRGLKALD